MNEDTSSEYAGGGGGYGGGVGYSNNHELSGRPSGPKA